jgi:hypothetical protein
VDAGPSASAQLFAAVDVVRPSIRWATVRDPLAAEASPEAVVAWASLADRPRLGALTRGVRRVLGNQFAARVRGNDEEGWRGLVTCGSWLSHVDLLDRDLQLMGQVKDGAKAVVLRLTAPEHGEVAAVVGSGVTIEQLADNLPWIRLRSPSGP